MVKPPLGLSPDLNSIVSPAIGNSLIFSWAFIGEKNTDKQTKAVATIYEEGSTAALFTVTTTNDTEVNISGNLYKMTYGKKYQWQVQVKSSDGTSATSEKKTFRYTDIGMKPSLQWSAGPESYEYIGSRKYFEDIRRNALLVLSDYKIITTEEKKVEAAARSLFLGEIVPTRSDFLAIEDVLGLIAEKEKSYKHEVDELIEDGLGAEDIHTIYDFFDRMTRIPPQSPTNVSLSFSNIERPYIESAHATSSGADDLTIKISWTPAPYKTALCHIHVGNELSEDVLFYGLTLTQGYDDYSFKQRLYYRVSDIVSMNREIITPMMHPSYHHLSSTKSAYYAISAVAYDYRGGVSSQYFQSYSPTDVPIGIAYYNLRTAQYNLADTGNLKPYYDIYNGPSKAYVHTVASTATGTYRYAIRIHDINGSFSKYFYINEHIVVDPLKPPTAPKVTVTATTTSSITWGWSAVPTATSYEIDPLFGTASNTTKTSLTHVISGLAENTSYSIRVRAINRAGASAWTTCTGKTNMKPIISQEQSNVKCRSWRTSYQILHQNGAVTRPAGGYDKQYDNVEVFHGQWIELQNKIESGIAVKKGTRWGNWKSVFFLDYSGWQSKLKGKQIVSVEIYIKRKSTQHGYPYDGRFLNVYTHNYANVNSLPAANIGPQLGNHYKVTNLDWNRGEGHWVTLPKSYGEKLRDGQIKGIAFHNPTSETSPYSYMRFDASTFKIRIKYK